MPTRDVIERENIIGDVCVVRSMDSAAFAIVQTVDGGNYMRGAKPDTQTIWNRIEDWEVTVEGNQLYLVFRFCVELGGEQHAVPVRDFFMVPLTEWHGEMISEPKDCRVDPTNDTQDGEPSE